MKASAVDQQRLLELQHLDSAIDRLAQRRRTLPELAEIAAADARLAELRSEVVTAQTEADDIAREQRKLENDVEQVRTRVTRDRERLDAGKVNNPRELENLQHEMASLGRRQGDLEDQVLEKMLAREDAQGRADALTAEATELTATRDAAVLRRDAAFAEIDAETAQHAAARGEIAPQLPDDLLALYEKIRVGNGGVGAAPLNRGRCEGCMLTISPIDLENIRHAPDDEVVRCEECRRILVRPAAA
ncbi:MAG: C4-type zinc ribbon domain-containing protein [Frankia sp.]|nr:C4-type zinc ribbon domain-containing protein [Frankia sp.]